MSRMIQRRLCGCSTRWQRSSTGPLKRFLPIQTIRRWPGEPIPVHIGQTRPVHLMQKCSGDEFSFATLPHWTWVTSRRVAGEIEPTAAPAGPLVTRFFPGKGSIHPLPARALGGRAGITTPTASAVLDGCNSPVSLPPKPALALIGLFICTGVPGTDSDAFG
jgi:hypothetical protein